MRRVLSCAVLCVALGCREPPRQDKPAGPAASGASAKLAPPPPAPAHDAGPPVRLFARKFVVKVRSAASKDAPRIGYMRMGALQMAKTAEPVGYDKCRKGWFEMETGGFVCATVDIAPFRGKRLPERRPTQPDRSALLPYPYGYSRAKNTPVYRRLPSDEEAAQWEGYRIPGVALVDGGAPVSVDAGAQPATDAPIAAGDPGSGNEEKVDAGPPTLESLLGEEGTVVTRRMERGFYVSLDREMKRGARRYWRTQSNGFIPERRLLLVKGTDFRGVRLKEAGSSLPVAFVMSDKHDAFVLSTQGKPRRDKKAGYHHMFHVVGEVTFGTTTYLVADDGRHYRMQDVTRIDPRPRPEGVTETERWVDVDLTHQSLVAYEGDMPVLATLISSGRIKDPEDPLKNFETPVGEFRISSKHLTATMDGDHALDGPYSIEDVPYVMYFQLAFAIHSAFWHNSFGRPRSHGCINVPPDDARWLFDWTLPVVPEGWHGAYPQDLQAGTRLYIHGTTPEG
jgi:hypothetical protein